MLNVKLNMEDAPILRLLDSIITKGLTERASDIHIEPGAENSRIRYRIDGLLQQTQDLPKERHAPLVSCVKLMAGMDIAEKRLPQDGRAQVVLKGRKIDLRVSSLPTILGEKLVLRILDRETRTLKLEDMGFTVANLALFRRMYEGSCGLVLITGPTGSGKTSTLYAALQELNSPERNIITVEDPVEYRLDGLNQVAVSQRSGLTFATGLRSILRQDPNVIMVGEIRDAETAEISIQAALTGHLVFSTLHTNTAAGAVTRLLDMGIEPFLLASALRGVVAQRLARRICPYCKQAYLPEREGWEYRCLTLEAEKETAPVVACEQISPAGNGIRNTPVSEGVVEGPAIRGISLYRGDGCGRCHYSGYKGRIAIQEVMPSDRGVRQRIMQRASDEEIWQTAQEAFPEIARLKDDGTGKILAGETTAEELLRILGA